jgi:tripartite-type tricarboxylate transporter receptor subunit TctC
MVPDRVRNRWSVIVTRTENAFAQSYPARPIRLIVGFAPGGVTDIVARMAATYMADRLKQPFIVENRTGAAGNLDMDAVPKAAPDGYTLLFSSVSQIAMSPHTYKNLPMDPLKDLEHITMLVEATTCSS